PAQLLLDVRDVEPVAEHVALARGFDPRRLLVPGDRAAPRVEVGDAGLDAAADVEDAAGFGRDEHGGDDVVDVDEVSGLPAVPEDQRLAALAHRLQEDRDHAALE